MSATVLRLTSAGRGAVSEPHDAEEHDQPTFEDAVRAAHDTSHSLRLDFAVQAALNADALTAVVDTVRSRDTETAELSARVAALEASDSQRLSNP